MNGNQIPPTDRDNAEVKWSKRKWNVPNESIMRITSILVNSPRFLHR